MKKSHLRVSVGIPSLGMWHADFAMSLLHMIQAFNKYKIAGYDTQELQVIDSRGSILPRQRLEIVKSALSAESDYLLWLDCDHTFPAHLLHQLLAHKKDVMAINCVTKSTPANPTARAFVEDDPKGAPIFTRPGLGIQQVWRVGTGVMLVNMDVYKKVGYDIFGMYYKPDVESYQGEDWTMCEAFERVGAEIWVDHDLSFRVGHIGFLEYRHDLVPETALAMAEEQGLELE